MCLKISIIWTMDYRQRKAAAVFILETTTDYKGQEGDQGLGLLWWIWVNSSQSSSFPFASETYFLKPKKPDFGCHSKKSFLCEVLTLSIRMERQVEMCVMVEMERGTLCFSWSPLVTRCEREWQNEGQRAMETMHPVTANEHTDA